MLKVPSFGMSTCRETFVPLIHCIIDYTLSLAMPDFCRTLLQFTDVMNLMSVANVSMHTSMPKEDILASAFFMAHGVYKLILALRGAHGQNFCSV